MSIVNLESLSPLSHSIRSSQFVHQSLIPGILRLYFLRLRIRCNLQITVSTEGTVRYQELYNRQSQNNTAGMAQQPLDGLCKSNSPSHLHSSRLVQTHIHQPGIMDHRLLRQQQDLLLRNLRQPA